MKKRSLSVLLALFMVLWLLPMIGTSVYAAPDGYTTDSNGIMAYNPTAKHGYDFTGCVGGTWRQVTFKNYGFKAAVYNGNDSLRVSANPAFIADGSAIKMDYTVKNTGSADVTDYRFYVAADTMIAGNDKSSNTIVDNSTVVMTSGNVSFFAFSTTKGCHLVATEYGGAGNYNSVVEYAADPSKVASCTAASDSAFVMYFDKDTLAAGAEKTYTMIIGLGETSSINNIIDKVNQSQSLNVSFDYSNEALNVGASGTFEITIDGDDATYIFNVSEVRMIPLTGTDANGKVYDFIGKKISIVHKGDETTADSAPETLEVDARPVAPDSFETSDITRGENQITVAAKEGYEYSIDGTNWVKDDDNDGEIVFSGLNNYKDYTVSYRFYATDSNFASGAQTTVVNALYSHTGGATTGGTTSPQTGDNSNIALLLVLLLAGSADATATTLASKKRKYNI